MIKSIIFVALGSSLGGVLRFLVTQIACHYFSGKFPLGTFLCNIIGCFIIGIIYALSEKFNIITPNIRLLLAVGLCGGFTTFSSFINENAQLAKTDLPMLFLYTGGSLIIGFMMLYLGHFIIKSL